MHDQACELSSLLDASNGERDLSCCIRDARVFDAEWLIPTKDHKYLRFLLQTISNNVWRLKKQSLLRFRIVICRNTGRKNVAALFITRSRKTSMSVYYVGWRQSRCAKGTLKIAIHVLQNRLSMFRRRRSRAKCFFHVGESRRAYDIQTISVYLGYKWWMLEHSGRQEWRCWSCSADVFHFSS